jgi:Arc/MetJ-type ribon-helix-helix transcriptional regulator
MTIEITKPETEALIERHLRSGRFHDIDELLKKALGLTRPANAASGARRQSGGTQEPV